MIYGEKSDPLEVPSTGQNHNLTHLYLGKPGLGSFFAITLREHCDPNVTLQPQWEAFDGPPTNTESSDESESTTDTENLEKRKQAELQKTNE